MRFKGILEILNDFIILRLTLTSEFFGLFLATGSFVLVSQNLMKIMCVGIFQIDVKWDLDPS